jgi:hypothetical protein
MISKGTRYTTALLTCHRHIRTFATSGVLYSGKLAKKIVGVFLPLQRNREFEVLFSVIRLRVPVLGLSLSGLGSARDIQAYYSRPTTKYLTRLVHGALATLHRFRFAVPLRRKGYR